ncbi:hypothetical protein [Orientia tsutsugamushi]|uniref:hypothetical protein n=1 Tax=Orientia tsutsugamushi TaxID=784 RepID=UPI0007E2E41A|nr:hypothetical protein [Orientia tsutsugamushi]
MPINQSLKSTICNHKFINSAIRLAYKVGYSTYGERVKETEAAIKGTGWKILCNSADYKDTNMYGYKAVAFLNEETNEIHVATAGTDVKDVNDLRDDLKGVYMHGDISKIKPMKAFIDKIVAKIGVEGYKYSTSGHSLGAVVSDLTAAEIVSRNLEFIESRTFDNPGSNPVVEYAVKNKYFSTADREKIYSLAKHCKVFNAVPNLVNSANDQFAAEPPKLVIPKKKVFNNDGYISWAADNLKKLCKPFDAAGNMLASSFGFNKISYAFHKVSNTINKASNLLQKVSITAHSHGLSNFEECEVVDVKHWGDDIVELDASEEEKLQNVSSTGNDGIIIEHKNAEEGLQSFVHYSVYACSDIISPLYETSAPSLTSFICYNYASTDSCNQINGACIDLNTEVD